MELICKTTKQPLNEKIPEEYKDAIFSVLGEGGCADEDTFKLYKKKLCELHLNYLVLSKLSPNG